MKKKITIIILSTLIILIITLIYLLFKEKIFTQVEPKEKTYMPITYEICDSNNCIYLLGSIHIGDKRITKFDKDLIELYNKSENLAVELDTKNIKMNLEDFIAKPNETLDILLPSDLKANLSKFLENKGLLAYEQLNYFKIGYVANYLSLLPSVELNLVNEGVDEYFLTLSHKENKKIIELETYEEQMSLLLGYSNELYINEIKDSIENYEEQKTILKNLYEEYLKADKSTLEELLNKEEIINSEEERAYQNRLIYERNYKMSDKLEEFLKEDKDIFMIVGLAHVLGDKGIIDLLQEKNYKINLIN